MKKKKTNLGKRIHMYNSPQDMENQFQNDVKAMGGEFEKLIMDNFDMSNPWDQSVLASILTNSLAYVEVYAEIDDCNMESAFKESYNDALKAYRQQLEEKRKNL